MDTVAKGEAAESGIDAFISKRDRQRRRDEGERPAEELWSISERIYAAKRRRRPALVSHSPPHCLYRGREVSYGTL